MNEKPTTVTTEEIIEFWRLDHGCEPREAIVEPTRQASEKAYAIGLAGRTIATHSFDALREFCGDDQFRVMSLVYEYYYAGLCERESTEASAEC